MSYAWRKVRLEPHRGLWWRWKATPIRVDDGEGVAFAGFDLELDGVYVLCHLWRWFGGRTMEQAERKARRWMERENARERAHRVRTVIR